MRRPDSNGSEPTRQRSPTVLPAPARPQSAKISPSSTVNESASSTVTPPTRQVSPTTSRILIWTGCSCGPPLRGQGTHPLHEVALVHRGQALAAHHRAAVHPHVGHRLMGHRVHHVLQE